jgi:hypothetical protein
MKIGRGLIFFILFIVFLILLISYLNFPKAFGRQCSCNPKCDFASFRLDSCKYNSEGLKLKITNDNIINLNVFMTFLIFPNKTYELRYLTDSIQSFTSKEFLIKDIPPEISSFSIRNECPLMKIVKNITDCS